MVDSRQKGARAENNCKALLQKYYKLGWMRVPSSGALDKSHGLKGDLYFKPVDFNRYCVEVKHYKDDALTSKVLSGKSSLEAWWAQTVRESDEVQKRPLLFFKHDRSKWFVAYSTKPTTCHYIFLSKLNIFISLAEDWLSLEDIQFEDNR